MSFQQPLSKIRVKTKRIGTTNQQKQSQPDLSLANPYANNGILTGISLVPDNTSRTDINIEIYADDDDLIWHCAAGDLTDINSLEIPIPTQGKRLQSQKNINIYIWNNGIKSNVTFTISFGVY